MRNKALPNLLSAIFIAIILIALPLPSVGGGSPLSNRVMDHMVIKGKVLKNCNGKEIKNLRLLAFSGEEAKTIPYQVDERGPDGEYVMVREGNKKDQDTDNGKLDKNDELVFMANDSGEKGDVFGAGINARSCDEIKLDDPKTNKSGFVYLCYFEQAPPAPSSVVYMKYNRGNDYDEIVSPYYVIKIPKDNVFLDYVAIKKSAGGNGKDLMDKIKMRSGVDLLSGVFSIERTEEDFAHRVLGHTVGPVRIIRQSETRMVILLSLKSPAVVVNGSFYPSSFQFPSVLSLPFRMDMIASDAYIRQGWDMNKNALGMKFSSNLNKMSFVYDGKMTPEEQALAKKSETLKWWLLTGEQGTFLFYGVWEKDFPIHAYPYYEDNIEKEEPPENDPGVLGHAYRLENLLAMGSESYEFNVVNYVVPNFDGDIAKAREVFEYPVKITVNP
jgi:hypothetical protein